MNGRIAGYNLNRYQAGTLSDFSHQTLIECGPAAIPAIYQAWSTEPDSERKEALWNTALQIQSSNDSHFLQTGSWKNFNRVKNNAAVSYEKMNIE